MCLFKHCQGEPVTTEIFLSLDGVRLSVVNRKQTEVVHLGISRYVCMPLALVLSYVLTNITCHMHAIINYSQMLKIRCDLSKVYYNLYLVGLFKDDVINENFFFNVQQQFISTFVLIFNSSYQQTFVLILRLPLLLVAVYCVFLPAQLRL